MQGRPRRSVLYMPGSNERALKKAKALPADALIFDLEDAVAPDAKAIARDRVCAAVKGGGYGARELIIRVNALETPWGHRRPARRLRGRPRRDPRAEGDASGRDHQCRQDPARRACPGEDPALGDDGNPDGDPERAAHRRDRRLRGAPALLPRHGHQRPPAWSSGCISPWPNAPSPLPNRSARWRPLAARPASPNRRRLRRV
jgi:hypothetical protein